MLQYYKYIQPTITVDTVTYELWTVSKESDVEIFHTRWKYSEGWGLGRSMFVAGCDTKHILQKPQCLQHSSCVQFIDMFSFYVVIM